MTLLDDLERRIGTRDATIAVIGLGYAGLPLALAFAKAGFKVRGYERDTARAADVQRGSLPFAADEPGLQDLLTEVHLSGNLSVAADEARPPRARRRARARRPPRRR